MFDQGEHLFVVQDNQPTSLRDIEHEFSAAPAAFPLWTSLKLASEHDSALHVDKGQRRLEIRERTSTTGLNHDLDWSHVGQVCRMVRQRAIRSVRQRETHAYVTSLTGQKADAARLLKLSRDHWGAIENGLYHVRDTTLGEDRCTITQRCGPENLRDFPQRRP